MTVQEQINQIAAQAKAKIDELVKLQSKELAEPQPGDWCVFWDDKEDKLFYNSGAVRKFKEKKGNLYYAENDFGWIQCRRITPEDFGWKLDGKPDWKDAPNWANYLAQDEDGSWWFFLNEPKQLQTSWNNDGLYSLMSNVKNHNWRKTLESRPQ
jgi:hypothetical protein